MPQDRAEAVKWYRKAAEQGFAKAQSNLGFMYSKGHSVPRNDVQAYIWYTLSASRYPPARTAITRSSTAASLPRR